jgi:signal transduction histidine kinase
MGVHRPATGDRVWLLVNALPELAPDGSVRMVLCTFTDITDRKHEEKRLHRSEELLRITQRLAKLGGWEWDLSTQAISWTEELFHIHDIDPGEGPKDFKALMDQSLQCYAAEDRAAVMAAFRRCTELGEPYDLEFPFTTPKGRQLWVRTVGEATMTEGRVVKVSGNLIDITEQVRKEEAAHRLEAQLHQIQKMESLGLLAGGVAHDINNVLGSILAVATIHRRKSEEGSALRQGMETITKACLRGGTLAESLRGFARKDLSEEGLLDLNSLIRDEVIHLKRKTPPTIRIVEELSDHLSMLKGDPAALSHAIMSLCTNATQAMPEGGTLSIRTRNDGLVAVLVEVEDSGIGMSPEVLHQAMAPFYTTRQSTTGSGLGLSIVYGTVRAHRGTIDLQSEPGRGTLVRLRFPLPGPRTEPPAQPAGATGGKHILLVDDDPLVLQAMPGLIECLGHHTTTAASGEEALALVDQGFRPDLVILDVYMPGIGGLETLVQLRKRDSTLPVLLTTGYSSEPLWELVRQHPGVQLLAKPYTAEDLQAQLRIAGC